MKTEQTLTSTVPETEVHYWRLLQNHHNLHLNTAAIFARAIHPLRKLKGVAYDFFFKQSLKAQSTNRDFLV